MITIEEIFLKLIQEQKKVFLPGMGQFFVERVSATIHPVTHEMTPPCSVLMFENTLAGDNQQLVNSVKEFQSISQEDAEEKVNQFLSILKNTFTNTKSFEISNVCTVKSISSNDFEVIVFNHVVIDKNDIGLNQIKSEILIPNSITPKTVAQPTVIATEVPKIEEIKTEVPKIEEIKKEEVINIAPIIMEEQTNSTPEINNTDTVVPENPQPKKKSKKGVWIFIIILLIAALGVVGFLFKDEVMGIVGCKTEIKSDTTTIVKEIIEEVVVQDTTIVADTAIAVVEPAVEPIVEPVVAVNPVKKSVVTAEKPDLSVIVYAPKNAGKYYVIAMSFKDLGNASKGVKQLKRKGYNPVVIDKNEQGLYRIAYKPGFETERLARDLADELYEKQNLDPWIVKY